MKKVMMGIAVVGMVMASSQAQAATASGSLTIVGQVMSSVSLTVESAGGTFTLGGTPNAATDLGTVSKYGAAPTGFTIATGATSWVLQSTIGVLVEKANLTSSNYTLNAQLTSAPPSGVIWSLNSLALSSGSSTEITATGSYGSTATYPWTVEVPDALASATALDNVIEFTAVSN